jgi:8-oxo-dGTP diphosphatase
MGNEKKNLTEAVTRLKEIMGIQEEKADRCLRIARRKYDKPSAYRSGAIVRCRQGKIWKDLKEAGELEEFQLNEDEKLIAMAHNALTKKRGRNEYAPDVHELQTWIDKYLSKNGVMESDERFQNIALDNLSTIGDFNKLKDIDKLALLGGTNDSRLLTLSLSNIFRENGGTFGQFEIKVRVKDLKDQKIKHKFSQDMAGAEGYLYPHINYSSENEAYVKVRFDDFQNNPDNFGGGNYTELPIMLDNMYPIDYDETKGDFVKYQNRVDYERKEFGDYFGADEVEEGKKTDYSKEKKSGLHGWFSRRGGEGNKGWVDCNTCKKVDGRKKCKACGREKGEKRSKYPSCRPTPASCGTPGKGKKWGKTKNESINEANEKPINRVALLFIVVDNKVLLFKRSGKETTNPSKYGMLGGGIEKGESPQNALKREIKEEAGVILKSFKPLKKYKYDGVELNVFYTNTFPIDKIELDKKEHTSHKLFTLEDVMNMTDKEMIQSNKKIARDYNKKVSKKKQLEEQLVKELTTIKEMMGLDENRTDYLKWKRKNVTIRGVRELGSENNAGAQFGDGLYTAFLSNKELARKYGDVYFVVNAIPKTPKVVQNTNEAEIFLQNVVARWCKENGLNYDPRKFHDKTDYKTEMLKLGYDGLVIRGREMVNYTPPENVLYFKNEYELIDYYNANSPTLNEDTFFGHHVWKHIVDITPNQDDVPWGFKKKIIQSDFSVDNNFNLESLLDTDPDFREYYESGDERYGEEDDVDETDLYHDIVVVNGELLDGYSRAATLLRNGETRTSAFVGKYQD